MTRRRDDPEFRLDRLPTDPPRSRSTKRASGVVGARAACTISIVGRTVGVMGSAHFHGGACGAEARGFLDDGTPVCDAHGREMEAEGCEVEWSTDET